MAFPYKLILCPVDFDENSMMALDKAAELARHFGSTVVVIHVVSPGVSVRQENDTRTRLSDISKQKLDGIKYESKVYTGDVINSILEEHARQQPDLIVMSTHGRKGFARTFLGSVAESVVRGAICPVLTVGPEIPSSQGDIDRIP